MAVRDTLHDTINDLREDAELIGYLVTDAEHKLAKAKRTAGEKQAQIMASVKIELREIHETAEHQKHLLSSVSSEDVVRVTDSLRSLFPRLHRIIGFVGAATVSSHWQSPAYASSHTDNVGDLSGKILAHYNDYTRDQHILGAAYEKAYRSAYIPIPLSVPVYTFATVSGMAAMTVAGLFVAGEVSEVGEIFVGSSCYFETKQLLHKLFGRRVHEADISNLTSLTKEIETRNPVAIFADTVGNEPEMRQADIAGLITWLGSSKRKMIVVADTSASAFMRPLMSGWVMPRGVTLIGVESQNKLLQYGLDRVTAGMVWGTGFVSQKLYDYRDHAGVNCPDVTIATLPPPNRNMAERYIRRLMRNTAILVRTLAEHRKIRSGDVTLTYPEAGGYRGVYAMLSWKTNLLRSYDRYITAVIRKANAKKISLAAGTSFGLATTRLYSVAMYTHYSKPFLRISPGAESRGEMEEKAALIASCL
jgi:cystathionine beta-lyase/cystathionine gamma-synthase